MEHPFSVLQPEYLDLLVRMQDTRTTEINAVANRLLGFVRQGRYADVSEKLGIPQVFIATSFERESSSNFADSPAQGDPWNRVSTHVPRGRGPFASWTEAALDAYRLDRLDQVSALNWTWARFCYEGELFNGFGYRAHGVHTPYNWAGTNVYSLGKYVADGVFDPNHADTQLGVVPVARTMALMDKSLDLPGWPDAAAGGPPAPPMPAPVGLHDAAALQATLNKLGVDPPLVVDGSYGRRTRTAVEAFQTKAGITADGLAGPQTWAAIEKATAA
jgi:lysozyme family protein